MIENSLARPPRRVGVLTFHRCINYGSYWQARCLVEGLRREGVDAVLLDHVSPAIKWDEWRCALRPTLPLAAPPGDFRAYAAKTRKFLEAFDALPLSAPFSLEQPEMAGPYDAIVIGSDEVWNLQHPWYGGQPIFYGRGLKAERLVSYAASFGNHDAARGLDEGWARCLQDFSAISVRDENSRQIVRGALKVEAELVLDPCLLYPPSATAEAEEEPYIALYGHGFPGWLMSEVRRFADRAKHRIVSIGYRNEGADEQRLDAGPESFARLIARSAAVVTNFFHGCIFALLNRRPLATVPSEYRFNKVRDLLAATGAQRHRVDAGSDAATYSRLLSQPPHESVHERIAALRRSSRDYLQQSLAVAT